MFKLITFDINGTLLKLRQPVGIIYSETAKLFGINRVKPESVNVEFKKEWKKLCLTNPNFGLNGIGWENWWKKLVEVCITSSTDEKLCSGDLNVLSSHLIDFYATKDAWEIQDGAVDLLESLRSNKSIVGAISNFDPRLHQILKEIELDSFFTFVLTSYETCYLKPDVGIFKLAERKYEEKTGFKLIGLDALHVGNSIEFDVNGARNADWVAAYITKNLDTDLNLSNRKHIFPFRHLCELRNFIT